MNVLKIQSANVFTNHHKTNVSGKKNSKNNNVSFNALGKTNYKDALKMGGAGTAAGAAVGAAAGSVIPIIGTGIGAFVGGMAGWSIGAIAGALMPDDEEDDD